ncbi:MAG: hypothetical protein RML46_04585, partial [Anaerolineae bacterium]|nr:hypothetical protein [Anaerolineae bacterium]
IALCLQYSAADEQEIRIIIYNQNPGHIFFLLGARGLNRTRLGLSHRKQKGGPFPPLYILNHLAGK